MKGSPCDSFPDVSYHVRCSVVAHTTLRASREVREARERLIINIAVRIDEDAHTRWLVDRILVAVPANLDAAVPHLVQPLQRHGRAAAVIQLADSAHRQLAAEHNIMAVVRLAPCVGFTRRKVDCSAGQALCTAAEAAAGDAGGGSAVRRVVPDDRGGMRIVAGLVSLTASPEPSDGMGEPQRS